eukprot:Skav231633  [mRNA]  locus=scaffold1135:126015:128528:+ [translate_table: standard]
MRILLQMWMACPAFVEAEATHTEVLMGYPGRKCRRLLGRANGHRRAVQNGGAYHFCTNFVAVFGRFQFAQSGHPQVNDLALSSPVGFVGRLLPKEGKLLKERLKSLGYTASNLPEVGRTSQVTRRVQQFWDMFKSSKAQYRLPACRLCCTWCPTEQLHWSKSCRHMVTEFAAKGLSNSSPRCTHLTFAYEEEERRTELSWPQAQSSSPELKDLLRLFLLRRPLPLQRVLDLLGRSVTTLLLQLQALFALTNGHELMSKEGLTSMEAPDAVEIFSAFAWWPVEDLLIATDYGDTQHAAGQFEPVMYLSLDSYALIHAAPRTRAESMLDICCGSGVQGLVALRHYAEKAKCCATFFDVNPRAIGFSRFNAAMNGFQERCCFVEGSAFELGKKLQGQTFQADGWIVAWA